MKIKQHALSKLFPALPDEELQALAIDIKEHGLHSPIVLYKGEILDGWHRYQACEIAGVNARSIDYKGKIPASFVKSANLYHRHLTASQRALTEVQLSEWETTGRPIKGDLSHPLTVAEMAESAGTDERTIQRAKVVVESGSAALKKAVKDDEISLNKAAELAKLPKSEQAEALKEKQTPKAKPTADPDEGGDTLKELEAADRQIRKLETLVESLKKTDAGKEIEAWALKYDQLEGRLNQEITTRTEAVKQTKYQTILLNEIRKILVVQQNKFIIPRIQELLKK